MDKNLIAELTDEQIAERVVAGETELFELLIRRHNRRVYRASRAILRDDSEAEDVMQDAYVRAFEHLHQFRAEAKFSTWLTRIAVNEALSRVRSRARIADVDFMQDEERAPVASTVPSPEKQVAASEMRELLERAVDRLPEGQRAVFILRDVEEMTTAETAACLNTTEDSVKVMLHRARRHLRELLYAAAGSQASSLLEFRLERCDRVTNAAMSRVRALAASRKVSTC